MAILVVQRVKCVERASTFSKDEVHLHLHVDRLPSVPRVSVGPAEMGPGSEWGFPENDEPRVRFVTKAWVDLSDEAGMDQHLGTVEVTPGSGTFEVEVNESGRYLVRGYVIPDPAAPVVTVVSDGLAKTQAITPLKPSFSTQYFLDKDETVPIIVEIGAHGLGSRSLDGEADLFKYRALSTPFGLQQRLADLGCDPGVIDGKVGRRTRAAVRKFQERHKLDPTGEADDETLNAIAKAFDGLAPLAQSGQRRAEALYVPDGDARQAAPPKQAKRAHRESDDKNIYNTSPIIEFISFGHSHRYHAEDYPRYAPGYHAQLLREARLLLSSIQSDYALLNDIVAGDGSLGAWMTFGLDSIKRSAMVELWAGKGDPPPKPEDYDPLSNRVLDELSKLTKAGPDGYGVMHAAGLEFMRVRFELQRMHRRVFQRVDALIKTAEQGEAGASKVESASFTLLDLYGQARFIGNPNGLMMYRIGILMVRCSARATGDVLADRSRQAIFRDCLDTARPEIVKILTDWLMAHVKKRLIKIPGKASPGEQLIELTLKVTLLVTFDFLDWELFEVERLSASERNESMSKWWERLEPKLFNEVVGGLLDMLKGGRVKGLDAPEQAFRKKCIETIFDVIKTLLTKINGEVMSMRKIAKQENRPLIDCVVSDFGPMVLRIVKDTATDMAESWVGDKTKGTMERAAGVTSDQKDKGERLTPAQAKGLDNADVGEMVRDSIASIKTQIRSLTQPASTPPVQTKTNPTSPLPKGPDEGKDGALGVTKLAPSALTEEQTHAQPEPGDQAAKLTIDERKKVEITPNPTPRSQPRVVVVEVSKEENQSSRGATATTLSTKVRDQTRVKQRSPVITAAGETSGGQVKHEDEPDDSGGGGTTPPPGGKGPPGGGDGTHGDGKPEEGPKPTKNWKGNSLKYDEVRIQHKDRKITKRQITSDVDSDPKLTEADRREKKASRYNEHVARIWLESEVHGTSLGAEDKETVAALMRSGLNRRELRAAGLEEVRKLDKVLGFKPSDDPGGDGEMVKCGDFIVPSTRNKGEVAFGDSKGRAPDLYKALDQVVRAYGMYKASEAKAGRLAAIRPTFYIIVPPGARPLSGELYIHNGRVFVGDKMLTIDGGEVQVVSLEQKIVDRPLVQQR